MRKRLHMFGAIVLMLSLIVPTVFAQDTGPARHQMLSSDGIELSGSGDARPATSGLVPVVVHLNEASLARLRLDGATPEQLVEHAATIAALQEEAAAQIEALGGKIVGRFKTLSSGLAVEIDASEINELRSLANVTGVRRVGEYELALNETVSWIGADLVQDMGYDGSGVTVAVIDSGVDYTHAKLGGPGTVAAYEEAYCGAPGITPDPTDPACTAHDFADVTGLFPGSKVVGGYDYLGDLWPFGEQTFDPNPIDFDGHGSHVADIIGGLEAGGIGSGVAPGVDIYAFKACASLSSACNGLALLLSMDHAADLDGDPATTDPVDVINMSLGALYGQPEDDLTAFANEITLLGTIVVAAAGNGSNKPFIVDSPSAATASIGVAQTTVPSAANYKIRRNAPEPVVIIEEAVWQAWSAPLTEAMTGDVVYGNGDGTNLDGCAAYPAGAVDGKVALVDRGDCNFSLKAANASEGGAILSIIVQNTADPPFSGGFGGDEPQLIPSFMIWRSDGDYLKVAGANITMDPDDPELTIPLPDTMVGTSSRGPRNHDNYIKPDIGAPGASVSAQVGTGDGTAAFGGTSGATPMVAGTAALLKQKYGGMLLPSTWLWSGSEMPVWMYKSLLMNTAETEIWQDMPGGMLAPITLIGGGRVDALSAIDSQTIAWDETNTMKTGDGRYRTGSMSFGYQAVTGQFVGRRTGIVANLSDEGRWYDLSYSFRYADDEDAGVRLEITPTRLYIPPHDVRHFNVRLTASAENMHAWDGGLNKGFGGTDGDTLTSQEYDGYIHIDGGPNNTAHLAWHILPKRAAAVWPLHYLKFRRGETEKTLPLWNFANYQDGDVDIFSLVDESPNIYGYKVFDDISGACVSQGLPAGCNLTLIDIKEVGVRHLPFIYADGLIEFGVTIWDSPYRAHEFPVGFDIFVDVDMDGVDDYLIENADLGLLLGTGVDGRNVVAVFDLHAGGGAIYFFTDSGINTQNWILTVPAAAIGVTPGQQFNFQVWAWDSYFTGFYTDVSPADGVSYHTYTAGVPKYAVGDQAFDLFPTVPADDRLDLAVTQVPGGDVASPSQRGLLLLYRQALIQRESDPVRILP